VVRVHRWQDLDALDPDLLRGGPPTRATDVWGLAATLHQVCSGISLYPGLEREQTVTGVQRVLFGSPEIASIIPDELAEVLEACFDADPANRPPTSLALAERLDAIGAAR
jgi:serine/threonine protein kinase